MRRRGKGTRGWSADGAEARRGAQQLVSEPQFLPGKDGWPPDEFAGIDHMPALALDALVLLEDGGRYDEVVLPLVELE